MKKHIVLLILLSITIFAFEACKKKEVDEPETPLSPTPTPTPTPTPADARLIFKFKFDSMQVRLNAFGQPSIVPAGNAALSPIFNKMGAHYIELAQNAFTQLGSGRVLYYAPETTAGGATAIDFSKSVLKGQNEEFYSMKLKDITPGTYEWIRVSLAYQNYDIRYKSGTIYGTGTIASFIGYNTFITNYNIKTQNIAVNSNKLQGYWGFETSVAGINYTSTGQAPPGATTVPNPIASTSPIPAGSCVVTAAFI